MVYFSIKAQINVLSGLLIANLFTMVLQYRITCMMVLQHILYNIILFFSHLSATSCFLFISLSLSLSLSCSKLALELGWIRSGHGMVKAWRRSENGVDRRWGCLIFCYGFLSFAFDGLGFGFQWVGFWVLMGFGLDLDC